MNFELILESDSYVRDHVCIYIDYVSHDLYVCGYFGRREFCSTLRDFIHMLVTRRPLQMGA